jgi:hypothetical protein
MDVRLITPLGVLFAVTTFVPLAVYVVRRRRLGVIGRVLGLESPTLRAQLPLVLSLAAVPVLLGIAAAQPVIETTRTVPERTDAQTFVVVDVSRSMLASAEAGAPTRLDRAREIALALRSELPEIPFGIASVSDRVLPHLFPTVDGPVFASTLTRGLGIEQPPPRAFYLTRATYLSSLRALPERNYFLPSATKRVVVVLTDGETESIESDVANAFKRRPQVETIFVHVWGADERIYETGVEEGGYRPDPRSGALLGRAASLVGGQVLPEGDAGDVADVVRKLFGDGETVARKTETGRLALMPYLTLLTLVPLGFVLLRRNVWAARRAPRRTVSVSVPAAARTTVVPAERSA